jgi:hypothetical protein
MSDEFRDLSDDELLLRTAMARREAHDAGKSSYAATAERWMRLADEVDRRGLEQPALLPKREPVK